ncbi:hypothetical protein ACFFRR_008726 [Megaselia abdita]
MTIPIEKALEMSLDEIIQETNVYVPPKRGGRKSLRDEFRDEFLSESNFKTEGRRKYDSDDDDDMIDIKPDDLTLNATIEDLNFDCTPFKSNSQQWRLQQPNNSADRPNGMAPIIPLMDPYDPIERPREYSNFKHFRNRNNNNYNNNNNNRRNNNNNKNFNNRRNYNNNHNNNQNNFNRNNNNMNNIIRNNRRPNNNNMPRNDNFIKDQVRNISFNNRSSNDNNFTVTSKLSLTSPSAQLAEAQNLISKSKVTASDMGTIASAMMAILRGTASAPLQEQKYDMEVQKEIHAMQKKPLFYKSSNMSIGGEVISNDGTGIDDERFTPNATKTSINQRFS